MKSLSSKAEQPAYERSRDEGKTWESCTRNDVRMALGNVAVKKVSKGDVLTSQWGLIYRRRKT